ncbi:(1-_4)-alpha-D-glucan 1-alpha-D-glucosylmutase [Nitrobacteraceae bacterium AZCC 1564]
MPAPIPLATYRIQLTSAFGFDDAATIVPYLKQLGITHLYASPFLKARSGSTHGYDIVDHNALNPELGGEDAFNRLSEALKAHDLGLILDFVPNHMGVHFADNAWWLDVLEWGPSSPYAAAFDIDWDTLPYRVKGGVLLPILGSSYGEALEQGQIELRLDPQEGSFSAWYYEHRLPIAPERYSEMLRVMVAEAEGSTATTEAGRKILELAARYTGLHRPNRSEAPELKAALAGDPAIRSIIEHGLSAYRAGPDRDTQTKALHSLLERQHYRLAHWRLATSEINYRRFFDVNSLAGLRVEDQRTFDGIHGLVKRLIAEDKLQGLRLDHIDGLRDPAQYCQRLTRLIREARRHSRQPFYLLIEKILGEHENLPSLQGVHGTTGYEWLNVITQVLLDPGGMDTLDEIWRQASNIPPKLQPVLEESKRRVLETLLTSEFTVLCRLLARIAGGHYSTRDFSADSLRQALELYVLHFPVYRTYMTAAGPSPADRELINHAIQKARTNWFGADEGIFDFLRDALTLDLTKADRVAPGKPRIRRFALKIQQFTGPIMAKSLEDTAFYRFDRLLAINEVGGDAAAQGLSTEDFHAMMRERVQTLPHGMTATATHDTKRGEDARARLLALPELADEWAGMVSRWKEMNARHVTSDGNMRSPSLAFEYMLYQALIGAWPDVLDDIFIARMKAYAIKAAREAKLETSWLNPNARYENALEQFIQSILDTSQSADFIESIQAFVRRTSLLGALNSISQITLKTMMPGVPDFYQGTEFWDCSLVDPDNRRQVDFATRRTALTATEDPNWEHLIGNWADGGIKLAWTRTLLRMRHMLPDVFTYGDYEPITVSGPDKEHVIAFARQSKSDAVIVAVGRCLAKFTDDGRTWPREPIDATLDLSNYAGDFETANVSKAAIPCNPLFSNFPAAIFKATLVQAFAKEKRLRMKKAGA